jgi:hypothetical protein
LNSLVLTIGSSRISVQGEIRNYSHPEVEAVYDILVHTQDFATMSPRATPAGDLRLAGRFRYANPSNQPLVKAIALDGTVDGGLLQVGAPAGQIDFRRLKGEYHLAQGNLKAPRVAVELLDGRLTGEVNIDHLEATPVSKVHASFEHISLEAARQSMRRTEVRHIPLTGTLDGTLEASYAGSAKTIRLVSELAVRGAISDRSAKPASTTPINGIAHLSYDGSHKILELRQTRFNIPSTSVFLNGQLSQHSNLTLQANTSDLDQLTQVAASLRKALAGSAPPLPAVSGSARLDGVVQGSIEQPAIRGQLSVQNLQVEGSPWSSGQLTFEANPSQLAIQNGSLTNARQGVLYFGAQVGLKHWTYTPSSPITANITARRISLTDLEHLANQEYPISGNVSARSSIRLDTGRSKL